MMDDNLKTSVESLNVAADGRITARIIYKPTLDVFEGHFPGQPIVPGIYHIEMLRHLHERCESCFCRIADIEEATFYKAVKPADVLNMTVVRSAVREGVTHAKAEYVRDNQTVARIVATIVAHRLSQQTHPVDSPTIT